MVRKAIGGTKGISRSLEALVDSNTGAGLEVRTIGSLIPLNPVVSAPSAEPVKGTQTHADLSLPFNLSLTDSQRAARLNVPLPYAHEGEGAGAVLQFDEEEEEDDEEI